MLSLTLIYLLAAVFPSCAARLIEDVSGNGFGTLLTEHRMLLAAFTTRNFEALHPFHDVFEAAADTVETPFVVVDCEFERDMCLEFDVNAYPAIKLFKRKREDERYGEDEDVNEEGGEILRYRGRRTKHAIRSFILKHELPVLTHIQPSELDEFKKIDDVVVVAYLRPDQTALRDVFRSVAENHYPGLVFGYSTDLAVADAEGLAMPTIVCYKNVDGDNKAMSGHFKEEDVEAFLKMATKDVIGEVNERNMDVFMAPGKLAAYLFVSKDEDQVALRKELTSLAKKFDKYVTFGVADAAEYAPMVKSFGLSETKLPALAIHAPMNDNIFSYRQGKQIQASVVEAMLTTILQAKATSGQVFGEEAPEMQEVEAIVVEKEHDEL